MSYQCVYNGYTDLTDPSQEDNIFIVSNVESNQYGTRFITIVQCNSGKIFSHKVSRWAFEDMPCEEGDIIIAQITQQNKSIKDEEGKWIKSDELETIIKDYAVKKKFQK